MSRSKFRFAPSPTGDLHLGNVGTAVVNSLCAEKINGQLLLRIDDTDQGRNVPGAVQGIMDDLHWLGIPYEAQVEYQSKRTSIYQEIAEGLRKQGAIYECFCTPEELEEQRQALMKMGKAPRYTGRWATASRQEVEEMKAKNKPFTWRLKLLDSRGTIEWNDLVRGTQRFEASHIGDFILLREDASATYNFASIIDDMDLDVTHIMRGEDHVSNTPKQIYIGEAIAALPGIKPSLARGVSHIRFGHIPIVLGSDKSKLSKRNGARRLKDYKAMGILPTALRNALVLLNWTPEVGHEILSDAEQIALASIEGISKSPSVFDEARLLWINSRHLKMLTEKEQQLRLAAPWIQEFSENQKLLEVFLPLAWNEISKLDELAEKLSPVLRGPQLSHVPSDEEKKVAKAWLDTTVSGGDYESWMKRAKEASAAKGKGLFMPLRHALTGLDHGFELKDLCLHLSPQEIQSRLEAYIGT